MNKKDREYIEEFLKEGMIKKSSTTTTTYNSMMIGFKRFWKTNKPLKDMDRGDFIDYVNFLKKEGNSANTIRLKISILGSFFTYLKDVKALDVVNAGGVDMVKNPFKIHEVKKLIEKGKRKQKDFLEGDEFSQIYKDCYKTRFPDRNQMNHLVYISPGGGRCSEFLGIKVKDIDPITGKTLIKKRMKTIQKPKGKGSYQVPVGPKGGKERTIRLTPVALDHVLRYIHRKGLTQEDYIYPSAYPGLKCIMSRLNEVSTINKNITLHRLRATSAIWCLRRKMPEKIIMKLFGWSTRDMLDVYIKLDDQDVDREIERIFDNAKSSGLQAIEQSNGGITY